MEDLAGHLAAASLEVDSQSEAAKLLLVSLMGSLSVVLLSRRGSADGKAVGVKGHQFSKQLRVGRCDQVTCLKIVGRITQQLKSDDTEEGVI